MVKNIPQPISMPRELFYDFRKALRGTRFENKDSGEVNASAAIRELMESVVTERNKKEELVTQQQVPSITSDILQTNDEYVDKTVNNLLVIDEIDLQHSIQKLEGKEL